MEQEHDEDNLSLLIKSEEGVIGRYWHSYLDGWNRIKEELGVSFYERQMKWESNYMNSLVNIE